MAPPPQHRSKGRNSTFALAVFVLSVTLGLAWAWQGRTVHIAETQVEVGVQFGGGPLEPGAVARLRLQGKLRTQPNVREVQVTPSSEGGPGQILHIQLNADTATAAQSAMKEGLRTVVAGYVRWQNEHVASQREAQRRLRAMHSQLTEALKTGRNIGYAKAALTESTERLNGVQAGLQALALTPPSILKPTEVHAETKSLDSSRAVAVLLMAIVLAGLAGARGWDHSRAVWVCGALMLAGLHQAESAPPGLEAKSYVRRAQLNEESVAIHPRVRRNLLGWLAAQVRAGHLPSGVRFDLRLVSDKSLGLYELRGVGDDPAELIKVVQAATSQMSHWNEQGLLQERRELRDRQNASRIHSKKLLAQDSLKVHRRFAQVVLDGAESRRAASSIGTDVTGVLIAPQNYPVSRGGRYLPYLAVGFVCGLLLLMLISQLRRDQLS